MSDLKRLQYKQIDFLRLFRLCREMEFVRRKRKMPNQYEKTSYINSSCSKLFKTFLTGLFSESDINVDGRRSIYTIVTPEGTAERLTYIRNNINTLLKIQEYRDLVRAYNIINTNNSGFITTPESYGFQHFTVTPISNSGRYSRVSASVPNEYLKDISRPKEEYYRCAKVCISFKEVWNNNVGYICRTVDNNRKDIEEKISKMEEEMRDSIRVDRSEARPATRNRLEQRPELNEQIANQIQTVRRRAQSAFNQALQSRRRVSNE